MLQCVYCAKEFSPARRFVQKFCSTSCRVLFHRHQGNRQAYLAQKTTDKPQPSILPAKDLIRVFYEQYLGKQVEAKDLENMTLLKQLAELPSAKLSTVEAKLMGHISRILQSLYRRSQNAPQQSFRIRMEEGVIQELEKYLATKP
jgi:hypothetical protein